MSGFLDPAALKDIGAGTLVVLAILLLYFGWLVPKRQHERELADRDRQIESLKELLKTEQGISAEVSKQNTALLPGANLATHIAEAIHEAARQVP